MTSVRDAHHDELPTILSVQHRAFMRVAAQAGIEPSALDPIRETLSDLQALWEDGTHFLVATGAHGAIVGSVRGSLVSGTLTVNRLVVDDGQEGRGVGTALMDAIETRFGPVAVIRLFTGAKATRPLALYRARGYEVTEIVDSGSFELAWMEKPGSGYPVSHD